MAAAVQFGAPQASDEQVASNPILEALLSQTGGQQGLQNVNSMAAANPQFGDALSQMSPGGGLNPQQASQFGPLFALMMSLQGGGGQQTPQGGGL
jgi:hypothetical protein